MMHAWVRFATNSDPMAAIHLMAAIPDCVGRT
jgi:hypothetical protein